MKKKRNIPKISFNNILQLELKKSEIYKSIIEGINEAIKEKSDEMDLCEIKNTGSYIILSKENWVDTLESAMEFFIEEEEYEECSKIKKILKKL